MMMLVLTILFALVSAGSIRKVGEGIGLEVSNKGQTGSYLFSVTLDSGLEDSGNSVIRITFPSEYLADLTGGPAIACSSACTVPSGNTVELVMTGDLLAQTTYSFKINNVVNPAASGGTGNFKIQSVKSSQVIDENLVLGSVGISSGIIPLSSASVAYKPGDSRQAG